MYKISYLLKMQRSPYDNGVRVSLLWTFGSLLLAMPVWRIYNYLECCLDSGVTDMSSICGPSGCGTFPGHLVETAATESTLISWGPFRAQCWRIPVSVGLFSSFAAICLCFLVDLGSLCWIPDLCCQELLLYPLLYSVFFFSSLFLFFLKQKENSLSVTLDYILFDCYKFLKMTYI